MTPDQINSAVYSKTKTKVLTLNVSLVTKFLFLAKQSPHRKEITCTVNRRREQVAISLALKLELTYINIMNNLTFKDKITCIRKRVNLYKLKTSKLQFINL